MKTKQTQRGIEYDLDVVSFYNEPRTTSIYVLATVENGQEEFLFEIENHGEKMTADEVDEVDIEMEEIEKWADATEIGWATSEIQKWCIDKTTEDKYWSFSVYTNNNFIISVFAMSKSNGCIGGVVEDHTMIGIEEVNDFLNCN